MNDLLAWWPNKMSKGRAWGSGGCQFKEFDHEVW